MDFKEKLSNKSIEVEQYLKKYIEKKDNLQFRIYDAMNYSVFAGGKRIRPILLLSCYEVFDSSYLKAMPFACALEMIHTYSLIHDDLPSMDDDDYRRGKLSNHKKYGEATAILAGDALLNKAFELSIDESLKLNIDNSLILKALSIMSNASGTEGMIGGQVVDMFCEEKIVDQDTLRYMHKLKTGTIIKAAASIGAVLGNASQKEQKAIETYAENLGLAFQVRDDILDVIGNADKLGKPIGSDKENKKATYVSLIGLEESKLLEEKLIKEAIASLSIFENRAEFLKGLANFLLTREY